MDKKYIAHKENEKEQSIEAHLNNTGSYAKDFTRKINFEKCGEIMGLIHDLGKYSDGFQARISEDAEKTDHSTFGAKYLYELFGKYFGKNKTDAGIKTIFEMMCLSAMFHHGGLADVVETEGINNFNRRINKKYEDAEYKLLEERGTEIINQVIELVVSDSFKIECVAIKEKLKIFTDDKNKDKDEAILFFDSLLIKYIYSCLIDADRIDTAEFYEGKFPSAPFENWEKIINALETNNKKFEVNDLNKIRNEIFNNCAEYGKKEKGFFKLAVPTGGGKTLSSFRFALEHAKTYEMERVIYIVPYISIIEQNAETIRKILIDNDINSDILIESHSNLDIAEDKYQYYQYYNLTDNWSGQIIFTTMVGFLESVFGGGTKNIRRFHNMANAVIIFDEIQSLPVKAIHMANMLMKFLYNICGSSIVLCSATQPLLDKIYSEHRRLPEPENIINKTYPSLERVEIIDATTALGYDYTQAAEFALNKLENADSMLIVVNTRKSALTLYKLIKEYQPDIDIYYLSTNLCPEHRSQFIKKIKAKLKTNQKVICVSTQLIEAGVDIDFNCVIRFTAGLDSIIQSAGRCNREGKSSTSKGKVYIINCNCESVEKLYDIKKGQECTERVLWAMKDKFADKNLLSDEAIDQYYQYYFHERNNEMSYNILAKECGVDTNLFELMSTNSAAVSEYTRCEKLPKYNMRIRQAFKTAGDNFKIIEDNQIGVIVPYGEGANIINNLSKMTKREILRKAQRYTVNIFRNRLDNGFAHYNEEAGVYTLSHSHYDENLGVTEEVTNVEDSII